MNLPAVQLPTDEKLANEGMLEFGKMLASLPEELSEKASSDEDLFKVYCGIFPEIGGMSGSLLKNLPPPLEQAAILIDAINRNGWARVIRHAHIGHSIVNLKAAARVVRNNSEYFPQEASLNPTSWIIDNPTQWLPGASLDIKEIRYGLLSGYPLNACVKCLEYWQVRKRLINCVLPEEAAAEVIFINTFLMDKDYSTEDLARFIEILRNKGKGLFTEDEISLWVQKHRIGNCGDFMGFDESDKAWASAADTLCRTLKSNWLKADKIINTECCK